MSDPDSSPGRLKRDPFEWYFIGGYFGTQYRVRFYPPCGYSGLYKEHNLFGFNHQKTLFIWVFRAWGGCLGFGVSNDEGSLLRGYLQIPEAEGLRKKYIRKDIWVCLWSARLSPLCCPTL